MTIHVPGSQLPRPWRERVKDLSGCSPAVRDIIFRDIFRQLIYDDAPPSEFVELAAVQLAARA